MVSLKMSRDYSRYIKRTNGITIPNNAVLVVGDVMIEVDGCLLSQNSQVFEDKLSMHYEVILDTFSDHLAGFYDCLKLLYGGTVYITISNIRTLVKFSVHFKIPKIYELCVDWGIRNISPQNFHTMYKIGSFIKELDHNYIEILNVCKQTIKNKTAECMWNMTGMSNNDLSNDLIKDLCEPDLIYDTCTLPLLERWVDNNEKVNVILQCFDNNVIDAISIIQKGELGVTLFYKMSRMATEVNSLKRISSLLAALSKKIIKKIDNNTDFNYFGTFSRYDVQNLFRTKAWINFKKEELLLF